MPDDFGYLEEEVMERMRELRRDRLSPGNRSIDTIFRTIEKKRTKEVFEDLDRDEAPPPELSYDPINYRDSTTPKPTKPLGWWASFWKRAFRR